MLGLKDMVRVAKAKSVFFEVAVLTAFFPSKYPQKQFSSQWSKFLGSFKTLPIA